MALLRCEAITRLGRHRVFASTTLENEPALATVRLYPDWNPRWRRLKR